MISQVLVEVGFPLQALCFLGIIVWEGLEAFGEAGFRDREVVAEAVAEGTVGELGGR